MGTVVQLDTAPSLKKYWRQKIADLIKESGIEDSLLRELTENTTQRKSLLWRIDHMNYSPKELEDMYHQYAPGIAESVNRASEKKQEQEKKQQEKRKAKRGW